MTKQVQSNNTRTCNKCGEAFPLNEKHFGHTPSGNFRNECRGCHGKAYNQWETSNPDARSARTRDRTIREDKAGGRKLYDYEKSRIRQLLRDKCAYCGKELKGGGHFDHKTPVKKGGKSEYSNYTLACAECNLAKHSKDVAEFAAWRKKCGLPTNFHSSVLDN